MLFFHADISADTYAILLAAIRHLFFFIIATLHIAILLTAAIIAFADATPPGFRHGHCWHYCCRCWYNSLHMILYHYCHYATGHYYATLLALMLFHCWLISLSLITPLIGCHYSPLPCHCWLLIQFAAIAIAYFHYYGHASYAASSFFAFIWSLILSPFSLLIFFAMLAAILLLLLPLI